MNSNYTRRGFLRAATGAISMSFGGMELFAGPGLSGPAGRAEGVHPESDPFVYGSAFYRPPNPPPSMRRAMLKTIAQEYRFNIIRIYPAWTYYHFAPERFNVEELEEVLKYCDQFGLRVLMGVVIEEAPYWLERAHPETHFVDARGSIQRLGDSGNNVSGGWPGLCLDWESVQQEAANFIHELAKIASAHPSMYAYDCWNEPHLEPAWLRNIWGTPQERIFCYCDKTIQHFHEWLEKRYGSLDHLNEVWVRRYSAWQEIDPPRAMGTYMDWVDWRRFIIERSTWEMQFRVKAIREVDAQHLLESHGGHTPPIEPMATSGTSGWRLAEVVQTWGSSIFPRWLGWEPFIGAAKFDITRSNAGGKPFWMTELQGGHGSSGLRQSPHMRPRDIRLWNWLAVVGGAKGIIYWAYQAEATGTEATGFGLVDRDGSRTDRAVEAARNNRLFQAHWDVLKDYRPQPQVAILTDQDSALFTFAYAGKEDASTLSHRGYYKALWSMDLMADYVEPSAVSKIMQKVLIVPWHLMAKQECLEALRHFVESGGTLILETCFGMFDERCFFNPVVPPYGLAEAFGYRERESYYLQEKGERAPLVEALGPSARPPDERIYFEPEIAFTHPQPLHVKGHTYLTPIEITSAAPIATCHGMTVAARKSVGKGEIYYFGTNLGASIMAGSDAGIELLRAIISKVVKPAVTGKKLRPRLIEGQSRSLLVVLNDGVADQTESIALPARYHRATDIHSQAALGLENGSVRVTVPYEDAVVLLLE